MRILAITFALSLIGCIDDDGTPVGVDDIEENTDDNFGPDILKGDVEPLDPKTREVTSDVANTATFERTDIAGSLSNARPDLAGTLQPEVLKPTIQTGLPRR